MSITDPGDLGRRTARRRQELGLTRADVADRAGMAPEFVDFIETQPTALPQASLNRLAAALETTPLELLGSGQGRPPGRRSAGARPKLRELSPRECWNLIAPGGIGRIAATTNEGPIVLPVNFIVDYASVVIRTTAYGVIGRIAPASELAFEVDRLDEEMRAGWSVLLVGWMERIDDPDDVAALVASHQFEAWAGGVRNLLLRIRPRRVTGRRIDAS